MSLLEPISEAPESQPTEQAPQEVSSGESEAKWWIDENTPGVGERPDFMPEKFKSVADLSKSYSELEKRFGQAPSEYDFSKAEQWADPEHEAFKDLAQFAKSKHVPQDVMDKMFESVSDYFEGYKTDYEAERAKLGDDAKEKLTTLNNWAKSNLSEDAYFALTSELKSAEAVAAIEELRQKMLDNNTTVPSGNDSSSATGMSREEVDAELSQNLDRYKNDPAYRKEIQNKYARVAPNAGFSEKVGG
jgi:hypothetical protein